MDSRAVAVGIQHAHAAGASRGFGQGAVVLGAVGALAVIGVIAFLNHSANSDKRNAVFEAENRSFSHGVNVAYEEVARTQSQNSRVVSV